MGRGRSVIPGSSGASSAGQFSIRQSVHRLERMNVIVIYSLIGLCQLEGCAVAHFIFVFRNLQLLAAAPAVCFQQQGRRKCTTHQLFHRIFRPVCNLVSSLMLKSELNKDKLAIAAIKGQICGWTLMEL